MAWTAINPKLYFTSIVDTVRGNDGFKWLWLLSKIEKEQISKRTNSLYG